MTFKQTLIICAAVAIGVWGFYTAGLKSQRDRLTADLADLQNHSASLAQELEQNRRALEHREAEKERLTNENAALIAAINEVYANDEQARDWAAAPCPDGVLDCLLR